MLSIVQGFKLASSPLSHLHKASRYLGMPLPRSCYLQHLCSQTLPPNWYCAFIFEILPCFYDHDREGDMEKDHQIENWHCSIFGSGKMGGQHPKVDVFFLFPNYSLTSCMCFVYGSVITLSSGIWTIAILGLESWEHLKHNEIFVPKLNFAKKCNLLALAQTSLMLWNYGLLLLHILFLPLQDML